MNERILVRKFGAIIINDEATYEYYLVEWTSEQYTV